MPAPVWEERVELAQRFAPHLVLFPEEQDRGRPGQQVDRIGEYYPRGIGPLLERGQVRSGLFQPRQPSTLDALAAFTRASDELLLLGKALPDVEQAWKTYFEILDGADPRGQTGRERYPLTIYARVQTRGEANAASAIPANLGKDYPLAPEEIGRPFFLDRLDDDDVSLQYWFCYYYDDWANQHEGDWEGISLLLRRTSAGYEPVGAGYYAHETGTRRHWTEVERSVAGGLHPLVYVAAGSHASYFQYIPSGYFTTVPGLIIPVVNLRLRVLVSSTRMDRVPDCRFNPVEPQVQVLPDPVGPADPNDAAWQHAKWLRFAGSWGVRVLSGLAYGGPRGPSHKGLKWHNPFAWAERYCAPDYLVY